MNEEEVKFFEKLKEMSKENPSIRVNAAANEITESLKRFCIDDQKRIRADLLLYFLSVLTGISCFKAAGENVSKFVKEDSDELPFFKANTEAGAFYFGDAINAFLLNGQNSTWNVIKSVYTQMKKDQKVEYPDKKEFDEKVIKTLGQPGYKIWNNEHNPMVERDEAKTTFDNLQKHLEPFELLSEEYPIAYAVALAGVIVNAEKVFPKELNCLEMCLESMIYSAHVDYF